MGGGGDGDFTVTISRKGVVVAESPPREERLRLSNLDLLLPVQVGVLLCYKNPRLGFPNLTFESVVDGLKRSLAKALVPYYALAGEIVTNSLGDPELLCNNYGVEFAQAYADVELKDLNFYDLDQHFINKLTPTIDRGVLGVQVTGLKCGGWVVSILVDHRVADGYSINMFLASWANMAQSKPISTPPNFNRSLVSPSRSIDNSHVSLFSKLPPNAPKIIHTNQYVNRLYYVTADQLYQLQAIASNNSSNNDASRRTKLESFSAFLWKKIGESSLSEDSTSKLGIFVDGRTRICCKDEDGSIASMNNYFGNLLTIATSEIRVSELNSQPLHSVANAIHEKITEANNEHFLGFIEWVERHRPDPSLTRLFLEGGAVAWTFSVSSGLRFSMGEVNFGWGGSIIGSCYFQHNGGYQYVMPMHSAVTNGDWIVYMRLLQQQLEFLEIEAPNVFRPLTSNYLGL
ncbi:hypothetical protein RJ641_020358 [Dillenia turbinata]|uniref:Uncharacterized protein n=1 Tax=Dillenia turbinata TaxID=194707 RepID=A0AAN8YW46_9MAGN